MFKFRVLALAIGFAVLVAGVQFQPAAAATAPTSEAASVVRFAKKQLGKPFKLGASGMRRFDCSGLVYRTFLETGLAKHVGGDRTSRGYFNWFKKRGLITKNPRKGDLVVWTSKSGRVSHIGIFVGYNRYGRAMSLSALTGGVAVHKVHSINKRFKAYLRVNIDR